MGCADSVAPHILEYAYLAAYGGIVDNRAQGAEIMVIAHTLEHSLLAVEEESLIGAYLDRAYAECSKILILYLAVAYKLALRFIQLRGIRRPQRRMVKRQTTGARCCHCIESQTAV